MMMKLTTVAAAAALLACMVLFAASSLVAAQEATRTVDPAHDCERVHFHGRELDPNNWVTRPSINTFEYRTASNATMISHVELALCNNQGAFMPHDSSVAGYAVITSFFGRGLAFDEHLYNEKYDDKLVYHYGSTIEGSVGAFLHINIVCDSTAAEDTLRMLNESRPVEYFNHSWDALSTITMYFGVRELCGPFNTTAMPTTVTAPPLPTTFVPTSTAGTMAPGETTAVPTPVPMDTCSPLTFNGKTVHPNNWPTVASSRITVKGIANTSSFWMIDLCSEDSVSGGGKRGFVISQPIGPDSTIPDNSYKWKLFREVLQNEAGDDTAIVWHFASEFTDDFIHVMVVPGDNAWLRFQSTEFGVLRHEDNVSFTYTALLSTGDLPPSMPKTTIPGGDKCAPFMLSPFQSVDPRRWKMPLRGSLVLLTTGARVLVYIDLCKIEPSVPAPRGYIILRGLNKTHASTTVAFDLFERGTWFDALSEYRVRYISVVSPEVVSDRVEIVSVCDPFGAPDVVSFKTNYMLSFPNELGGTTFRISTMTNSLCERQPTRPTWMTTETRMKN